MGESRTPVEGVAGEEPIVAEVRAGDVMEGE